MLLEQAEMQSKHETEVKDSRKRSDTQIAELQQKLQDAQQLLTAEQDAKRNLD